jgi:hypothetical protein
LFGGADLVDLGLVMTVDVVGFPGLIWAWTTKGIKPPPSKESEPPP